jgi:hypothetical protein
MVQPAREHDEALGRYNEEERGGAIKACRRHHPPALPLPPMCFCRSGDAVR